MLIENKFGRDEFGYDGFIKQSVSKEEREENPDLQMPIIGNYTVYVPRDANAPAPAPAAPAPSMGTRRQEVPNMADEDCPF